MLWTFASSIYSKSNSKSVSMWSEVKAIGIMMALQGKHQIRNPSLIAKARRKSSQILRKKLTFSVRFCGVLQLRPMCWDLTMPLDQPTVDQSIERYTTTTDRLLDQGSMVRPTLARSDYLSHQRWSMGSLPSIARQRDKGMPIGVPSWLHVQWLRPQGDKDRLDERVDRNDNRISHREETSIYDRHWKGVRREEQHKVFLLRGRKLCERCADFLDESLEVDKRNQTLCHVISLLLSHGEHQSSQESLPNGRWHSTWLFSQGRAPRTPGRVHSNCEDWREGRLEFEHEDGMAWGKTWSLWWSRSTEGIGRTPPLAWCHLAGVDGTNQQSKEVCIGKQRKACEELKWQVKSKSVFGKCSHQLYPPNLSVFNRTQPVEGLFLSSCSHINFPWI